MKHRILEPNRLANGNLENLEISERSHFNQSKWWYLLFLKSTYRFLSHHPLTSIKSHLRTPLLEATYKQKWSRSSGEPLSETSDDRRFS